MADPGTPPLPHCPIPVLAVLEWVLSSWEVSAHFWWCPPSPQRTGTDLEGCGGVALMKEKRVHVRRYTQIKMSILSA